MQRTRLRIPSLPLLAALLLAPLSAQAADAEPPRCRYPMAVDLPIRYVGRYLQPAVDGTVNGTPATLFVDTGSEFTALTMTGVARRDLNIRSTGMRATGIGGLSRVYATHIKQLGIGPIDVNRRLDLAVIGDTAEPPEFDVLVGAPFLLMMDLMLDLRGKRLVMYQPQNCDKTDLLLWKEDTIVVPFYYTNREKPNPHFTVLVDGKKMDAIIDSGASRSFLSLDAARRIGFDPKNPNALRLGESSGVGSERAARWAMPVKTVEIGGERILDAELGVIDVQGNVPDLLLGQDFLRAHRVLFAMGQEKLYLAYLGGDVFVRGGALEPWMRAEASAGNADAQYALATMFGSGRGAPRDPQQGRIWLDQAAAAGQPNAMLQVARRDMLAGRIADAIPKMRTALDRLPAERYGPLWLYLARVKNGEAELARTELQAGLKKQQDDEWPYPVAQFFLGKWDADKVMREAADDKRYALPRGCQARSLMAEWQDAHGNQDKAAALRTELRAQCAAPPPAPKAASAASAPAQGPQGG